MSVLTLRSHQVEALKHIHNGSILAGGVGSGKTVVAVEYYKRDLFPMDVVVITTAKKRDDLDWDKEFARIAVSKARESSYKGVQLTVDSWNNIDKYSEVKDAFFIFDEQRLVGAGAWSKAFLKIARANRWIMLSATPGDNWIDYIPVFLANGFYKNRSEFVYRHVVYTRYGGFPKVDRYLEVPLLERLREKILVEMPFERHTIRCESTISVDYDKELFKKVWEKRWHVYEDRPLRDIGEMFMVSRKVVSSDLSRLEKVVELSAKHNRLIVFYNFNHELDNLRKLKERLPEYTIAEYNGHKHQEVPTSDKWIYLVQYTAGAEGWNCITTDAMIFYSLSYSYKIYEQSKGRTDRLNTPFVNLYYYVFRSNTPIDQAIWKSLKLKQNFNLRKMKIDFDEPSEDKMANALESKYSIPEDYPAGSEIGELIHRRRRQVMLHSMIYYHLNESIIPDETFDEWSRELAKLQREHPEISKEVPFQRKAFESFDGSSGYHLPIDDVRINNTARRLVEQHKKRG